MLQSGSYVVPTFNGAPRYAKPPLIYWCQSLSFSIFGENALTARLPSLLAVAGTALLLYYWGNRLGSGQAGLIAGLAYAFCLQTMQQGRVATADALLIFFTTLAGFAGWRLLELGRKPETTRSWNIWGLVLAIAFGGGFLAKGPEALLPFVALLVCAWRMGPRVLTAFAAILALGLLVVACWAIPAYVETGGAYWREGLGHDVGDRMVTGFQGHGASKAAFCASGMGLDRPIPAVECRTHLRGLLAHGDEASALHPAGLSVPRSLFCTALAGCEITGGEARADFNYFRNGHGDGDSRRRSGGSPPGLHSFACG
jgi:4-amino-4-deoxy-L-arabinose transferase-like glycosyltransferase